MLPLAAMAGYGLLEQARSQRQQAERTGLEITRALATAVDAELGRAISVLEGIAVSPALDMADLERYREVMRRVLQSQPEWITLTLADADGRLLADSTDGVTSAPVPMVAEPESVQRAVSTRRPSIGYLSRGPGGRFAVPVRVPILRNGEARYVLSAVVKPDVFVQVLARQQIPENWVVSVFDTANLRVARSRRHVEFLGAPPAPTLARMMAQNGHEGTGLTKALEGDEVHTAFSRSRDTGWTVAIGIPTAAVDEIVRRSLEAYGAGLVLSLGLGLGAVVLALRAASAADAERERLLQREQEARASAEAASRTKDEFLAMLGHELRNPIGALFNASQLLQHPRADAEASARAREVVARQV
ncbi:MAG TPA: cache domain-containing protein, partial [Burkholderiales bacterium]|nr:cache domain-containing protein [Burkholderiales bacterium]